MTLVAALLTACGGGGGGGGNSPLPAPPAPPPVPAKATLNAANYQNAFRIAMANGTGAFQYANLGVKIVDGMLNLPLGPPLMPAFACPESGSVSIELTDKNADRSLDPGDTIHYRYNECKIQGTTTSGVIRVELTEATQIAGGRDYRLTVTLDNFRVSSDLSTSILPAMTINFVAQVHYVRDANSDFVQVMNAAFTSGPVAGDTGTSTMAVEYLQNRTTQTYVLTMSGNFSAGSLGGALDFSTAEPFTGVIGEFPSAGRAMLGGNAAAAARLSEEGAAANDNALVFSGLDTNGDGVLDAADASLAWSTVVPVQFFEPFGAIGMVTVPMP